MTAPIRVLLIDDDPQVHEMVALALGAAPDMALVGHGYSGAAALELCRSTQPDVVLMDVLMPVMDGIAATHHLSAHFPAVKVLALSGLHEDEAVHAMLQNGAAGYVAKGALARDLVTSVRAIYAGHLIFSREVGAALITPPSTPPDYHLSARAHEVLRCMVRGMSNPVIADALAISLSTVKFHIANIMAKMGVAARAEAVAEAVRCGLG